jgi:hypothetical protein
MKAKGGFYTIWSLIGLLNSGLYAVVGAVIVGLRKSQSKSFHEKADPCQELFVLFP